MLVSTPLNIRLGHHPTTNVSTCAKSITVHIQRLSNWEPCPGRGSPRNAGEALAGLGSGPCQICQGALQRIDHHGFKNWSHKSTYLDLSGLSQSVLQQPKQHFCLAPNHSKSSPQDKLNKQGGIAEVAAGPPSFYHLFRHHLSQTEEIHQAFGSTTPGHHIIHFCQDFQVGPMVNWL